MQPDNGEDMVPNSVSSRLRLVVMAFVLVVLPGSASSLLINGDFDAGPSPDWSEDPVGLIVNQAGGLPVVPHSGTYSAWLGGAANEFHRLYQVIAVPADTTLNALNLQLLIGTDEIGLIDYDTVVVSLEDPGGAVLETLGSWSNLDETVGWTPVMLPIFGSYSGQTIRLAIQADNDPSYPTSFFFDSIALAVVPEPTAFFQQCAGLMALLVMTSRKRRTARRQLSLDKLSP